MTRLVLFVLILLAVGWPFAYWLSGKNQRRALLGMGKVLVLLIAITVLAAILLTL